MKKLAIGLVIAVIVLSISAMSALAASESPGYVDEDGDGICDRRASCGMRRGNGRRANFVDADGDGACDNAGAGCRRNG